MSTENPFDQIKDQISELKNIILEFKKPLPAPEQSDRCTLTDACIITGLSRAAIYSATHLKKIPYAKFGNRLVFSRHQIAIWVESHTLPPTIDNEVKENLQKSATKKLGHEI